MPEYTAKGSKEGKKTLGSISIEKAANGFMVNCHYRYSGGGKDSMMGYDNAADRHVFDSADATADFVRKELGG